MHPPPLNELVADTKNALSEAQQRWEQRGTTRPFDPAGRISMILTDRTLRADPNDYQRCSDLTLAWDVLALPYIQNEEYRCILRVYNAKTIIARDSNVVSLNHEETAFIDAMMEHIGIPHPRTPAIVVTFTTEDDMRFFIDRFGTIDAFRCGIIQTLD
jgi:hypothetical protein